MGMQLTNIVLLIVAVSSFNSFCDGMFGHPSKYRGQAEYWGPSSLNVLNHRTRTSRDVVSNESEIRKQGKTQEQRLIHDFFINDYVRKFILRLFPELKGEENRLIVDYMTNEVVQDMKAMKATDWQPMNSMSLMSTMVPNSRYQ